LQKFRETLIVAFITQYSSGDAAIQRDRQMFQKLLLKLFVIQHKLSFLADRT